jgi:hypothetical protein
MLEYAAVLRKLLRCVRPSRGRLQMPHDQGREGY